MGRLFNAEPSVYPDHESHRLGDQELADMRDKLEDEGEEVNSRIADEILRSRARQAVRFYARRIVDREYAGRPESAKPSLQAFPTWHSGHFSNVIGEVLEEFGEYNGALVTGARLMISRMTRADGAPCDRCIEVEFRMGGNWVMVCPSGDT